MLSKVITRAPNFLKSHLIYSHCSLLNLLIEKTVFAGIRFKGSNRFLSCTTSEELSPVVRTTNQYAKNSSTHLSTIEDLQNFVSHPNTTVNDILDIDIRLLPSEACMMCLEALLRIQNRPNDLLIRNIQNDLRNSIATDGDWPSHYIKLEHITRWHQFDIGINSFHNNVDHDYSWMDSEKFDLLLLTTAACAESLPTESLLKLSGYFQYFWNKYEPKVYASVLRHLNNQINELSCIQLAQLAHILSDLDDHRLPIITGELHTEIDLLRSAISIHLLAKKEILSSIDPTVAIRMIYDLRQALSHDQRLILFDPIYHNLILNGVQWNLYTVVFLLLHACKLKICKLSIIKSCLSKIPRKLRISNYHPSINQSQWINAILAALANYTVSFHGISENCEEELLHFIEPPYRRHINDTRPICSNLFSAYEIFTSSWVKKLFDNISQHITSQQIVDYNSLKCLAQITYSLSLFGYKADSFIEHFNVAFKRLHNDISPTMSTTLTNDFNQLSLYISMAKCILNPLSKNSSETEKLSISSLPLDYWRFYYQCGLGLLKSNEINDPMISHDLVVRNKITRELYYAFLNNKDQFKKLTMDVFQCVQYPNSDNSNVYFADILFKQESEYEGKNNYVICIVHEYRDEVAKGPLSSLLNFYRETQCLPVLTFNLRDWYCLPHEKLRAMVVKKFLLNVSEKLNEMNNLNLPEIHTTNAVLRF